MLGVRLCEVPGGVCESRVALSIWALVFRKCQGGVCERSGQGVSEVLHQKYGRRMRPKVLLCDLVLLHVDRMLG